VFIISIANFKKSLVVRIETDLYTRLLEHYFKFLSAFNRLKAKKLPPLRGFKTDYAIKLEKVDRKELTIP
jgi:hypothetical protein